MVANYTISEVAIDESEAFLRVARLTAGSHVYDGLSLSSSPAFTHHSDVPDVRSLNEGYLAMDVARLREIDGDPDAHDKYVRHRFRGLEGNEVNLCLVNLIVNRSDKVRRSDVEYLNDLLLWPQNDIYVPPTMTFGDGIGSGERMDIYDQFLASLLEVKRSTTTGPLRVGCLIPSFYSRARIPALLRIYEKEERNPAFVVVDFANKKLTHGPSNQKLAFIHRHFRSEREEKYFLYVARAKARRRGPPPSMAEDVATLLAGANAIGPTHRLTPLRIPPIPFDWDSMIGLVPDAYDYDRIVSRAEATARFRRYLRDAGAPDPNLRVKATEADRRFGRYVRGYNRRVLNEEGKELATRVRKSEQSALRRLLHDKEAARTARSLISQP